MTHPEPQNRASKYTLFNPRNSSMALGACRNYRSGPSVVPVDEYLLRAVVSAESLGTDGDSPVWQLRGVVVPVSAMYSTGLIGDRP